MKHLFWGIALLLTATAAAQTQPSELPVMRMGDPDLYLELKHRVAPPPAPAAQTAQSDEPSTAVRNPLAEYLLHLAAQHHCCPDKYTEEMWYLYQAEIPLTAEQLDYLVWSRRLRD